MPTSIKEAVHISNIINYYLGPRVSSELTKRLYDEIGQETENDSLKASLEMLKDLYNPEEQQ